MELYLQHMVVFHVKDTAIDTFALLIFAFIMLLGMVNHQQHSQLVACIVLTHQLEVYQIGYAHLQLENYILAHGIVGAVVVIKQEFTHIVPEVVEYKKYQVCFGTRVSVLIHVQIRSIWLTIANLL